ncbi:ABC transporter ATP-binding protein [Microbacter margulisiae]|uniref:Lipoprotein-releasing system ATP-binding protein n=1 Tax=Microbacter margulisiae TaxID=1350067 RepID=A0A7W5DPY5_9PORP|nr:ABC transporter ATP-binding protein [Microbacter margulisiae]MBB3186429.1 lipoprotein-releasing system ATP-binding protein [Microbacter margulisiae]
MIQLENITKRFGSLQVLKGIDFSVNKSEIVSIVGPSGAGKTTLLHIMGTLERPDAGSVVIDSIPIQSLDQKKLSLFRNQHIGFVFQIPQLLPEFSALENVMLPALIAKKNYKTTETEARELLQFLHVEERAQHKPNEMSGGERQRVAIARALINRPSIILADEPSGSLDSKNKEELHRLFFDVRDRFSLTIVIVTHDKEVSALSDRIVTMRDGMIDH